MNKLVLVFIAALTFSSAYAYNSKYVDIYSGETKNFDVAGTNNQVSLRWEVKSKNGFTEPTATVISEDGSFQCQFKKNILLFSGFDQATQTFTQSWEIKVAWQPGTDHSGCLIRVSHPNEEYAYVNLFMNYHGYSFIKANFSARHDKKDMPEEGSEDCDGDNCDDNRSNGGPDSADDEFGRDRNDGDGYSGDDNGGYNGI